MFTRWSAASPAMISQLNPQLIRPWGTVWSHIFTQGSGPGSSSDKLGSFQVQRTTLQCRSKRSNLVTASQRSIVFGNYIYIVWLNCKNDPVVAHTLKADSHIACRYHAVPMPRRALIHTRHAAPLLCSDSAVSFVKVRIVAGYIRKV